MGCDDGLYSEQLPELANRPNPWIYLRTFGVVSDRVRSLLRSGSVQSAVSLVRPRFRPRCVFFPYKAHQEGDQSNDDDKQQADEKSGAARCVKKRFRSPRAAKERRRYSVSTAPKRELQQPARRDQDKQPVVQEHQPGRSCKIFIDVARHHKRQKNGDYQPPVVRPKAVSGVLPFRFFLVKREGAS